MTIILLKNTDIRCWDAVIKILDDNLLFKIN